MILLRTSKLVFPGSTLQNDILSTFCHILSTFGHILSTFGHVLSTFGHILSTFGHILSTFLSCPGLSTEIETVRTVLVQRFLERLRIQKSGFSISFNFGHLHRLMSNEPFKCHDSKHEFNQYCSCEYLRFCFKSIMFLTSRKRSLKCHNLY